MSDLRLRYVIDDRIVFKVSEAARMLDVDVRRIYQHISAGTLLAVDIRPRGSVRPTYRITRASLEAFMAAAESHPVRSIDAAAAEDGAA